MHQSLFSKKPLAFLIASMAMLNALPAAATVIDGLTAQTSAQTSTPPVTDGPNTSTTYASAYSSSSNLPSQASASSFGYNGGPYGAGGNGSGVFDSTGTFQRQWDITNDSGVAQNYSFNFFIYYGSMYANNNGAGGTGYAEYMVNILRDPSTPLSTSLFSSAAKIASDGTLTTSGTTLTGALQSGSSYSWGGTNFTIDLGVLNPGDFTSVRYDLVGHAYGNYDFFPCAGGGNDGYGGGIGGIGDGGDFDFGASVCTGSSNAFLGDPDSLNTTPIAGIGITAHAVPEPATLALLGMGLAAFGLRRRPRK